MKTVVTIGTALIAGLLLPQVSAQNIFNDPAGLDTLINTNNRTFQEQVGNITATQFNALDERLAFTFEEDDGYSGTQRFDRIELLESNNSPINLRINFGSDTGFRIRNDDFATGGNTALVYQSTANTVTMDFINPLSPANPQPVTGVGFTANRLQGSIQVSLYSDLARTQLIGSSFTLNDNNANSGSNYSFFGFFDGGASIASIVLDTSGVGQFWIDDLNITTVPEPSSLILLLLGAFTILPWFRARRR